MKTIATIFNLLAAIAFVLLTIPASQGQVLQHRRKAFRSVGGGPSYLVEENFEGTGTPSGWTTENTVDFDYTGTVLQGAQSARLVNGFGGALKTFTSSSDVWLFFKVRFPGVAILSGSNVTSYAFRDVGDTIYTGIRLTWDGIGAGATVKLRSNGVDYGPSATTITVNTTYNCWIHYVASGTATIHMSTSTTKPLVDGSGDVYVSGACSALNVVEFFLRSTDYESVVDRVLVSNSTIGDNP